MVFNTYSQRTVLVSSMTRAPPGGGFEPRRRHVDGQHSGIIKEYMASSSDKSSAPNRHRGRFLLL